MIPPCAFSRFCCDPGVFFSVVCGVAAADSSAFFGFFGDGSSAAAAFSLSTLGSGAAWVSATGTSFAGVSSAAGLTTSITAGTRFRLNFRQQPHRDQDTSAGIPAQPWGARAPRPRSRARPSTPQMLSARQLAAAN
eukprot:m.48313 g.48313  ORF g.48313 m.48313 type:complete len:136 (-) comp6027_c0_seq1:1179-1586(-)